jgi:hypothetical protein
VREKFKIATISRQGGDFTPIWGENLGLRCCKKTTKI